MEETDQEQDQPAYRDGHNAQGDQNDEKVEGERDRIGGSSRLRASYAFDIHLGLAGIGGTSSDVF